MPINLRMDQTVTFTVEWKDSLGNVVAAPADATPYAGDASVTVTDLGGGTYQVHPHAIETGVQAGVSTSTFHAVDQVNIEGGVATSGTVVWGTPTPA